MDNEELEELETEEEEIKEKPKKEKKPKRVVSKAFEDTIKEYLDNYANGDSTFANKYYNPKKSITECSNFIVSEVQKMNVKGLADDEVYYLARHYYEEDNLTFTETSATVVVNHTIELTEEEKQQAREKAIKDFENAELEKLKKQAEKEKAKEKAKEEKIKKEKEESKQLSLFDF